MVLKKFACNVGLFYFIYVCAFRAVSIVLLLWVAYAIHTLFLLENFLTRPCVIACVWAWLVLLTSSRCPFCRKVWCPMFHFDALPSCYSVFGIWTSNLCTSKTGKSYRWKQCNLLKGVVISTSFTVAFEFWNILPSPNDESRSVYQWNRRLSNIQFLMSTPGEGDCIYFGHWCALLSMPQGWPKLPTKS